MPPINPFLPSSFHSWMVRSDLHASTHATHPFDADNLAQQGITRGTALYHATIYKPSALGIPPRAALECHGTEIEGMPCFQTPLELRFTVPLGSGAWADPAFVGQFTQGLDYETPYIYKRDAWTPNLLLRSLTSTEAAPTLLVTWGDGGQIIIPHTTDEKPYACLSDVVQELSRFQPSLPSLTVNACRELKTSNLQNLEPPSAIWVRMQQTP